tara:strand:+ start:16145 stop:17227 length:1083 start_codon:yes stop_codon:yes gene_type:complete
MSAYKQLNSQDLIVSPFEVNKNFYFEGGDALTGSDVGIDRYLGKSGNFLISQSLTGNIDSQRLPEVLVYDSIRQLYYGNYISGSGGFTGDAVTASILIGANSSSGVYQGPTENTNFYNYEQTTLWPNKDFPVPSILTSSKEIGVLSIPSKLWGDYIQPNSFLITGPSGSIKDDGEGRLLWKHPNEPITGYEYMAGNIIYQHGIVTLFDSFTEGDAIDGVYGDARYGSAIYGGDRIDREDFINAFITSSNVTMSFSSSYKIFETQYQVTINEDQFNYSTNPTIVTGSTITNNIISGSTSILSPTSSYGTLLDFATGSYFEPYITTVGLYDNDFQLLAVGKLAQPLQTSNTTDTTILINIDR